VKNIVLVENDNSIEFIKLMLEKMLLIKASDVYLSWNKEKVLIKYRVNNNVLKEVTFISKEFADTLKFTLIALSGEDEYLKVIDGKFNLEIKDKIHEFRLSIAETINGNAIVIRQYEFFNSTITMEKLGFMPEVLESITNIIENNRYGLFLVTGPTGSGKTTTLYTLVNKLLKEKDAIIKTVEDPVELYLDGIDQFQINLKGDKKYHITYNTAIKTFLRQRPDYILIGEIRDGEVAENTFRASFTGHFVFSTLHTGSVENTLTRLFDLGISHDKVEDSLCGVLNQMLIPRLCDCKIKSGKFYKANPNGCEKCRNNSKIGYNGLNIVGEIAELKIETKNYKQENWKKYISIEDNLKWLYNNGLIDKIIYNFYKNK
jgi:type IV pilus assembly protein PilB